jgi:hypothetical protein
LESIGKFSEMGEASKETNEQRFWGYVNKTEGCWLWKGKPKPGGYGQIRVDGRTYGAHVFSWMIHHGAVPRGYVICHKCDVRLCVNPEHLFIGTYKDNEADKIAKKRHSFGVSRPLHRLDDDRVMEIKRLLREGLSQRKIGSLYGVSHTTVGYINRGKTWKCANEN